MPQRASSLREWHASFLVIAFNITSCSFTIRSISWTGIIGLESTLQHALPLRPDN
jgi:hypothetical protein